MKGARETVHDCKVGVDWMCGRSAACFEPPGRGPDKAHDLLRRGLLEPVSPGDLCRARLELKRHRSSFGPARSY